MTDCDDPDYWTSRGLPVPAASAWKGAPMDFREGWGKLAMSNAEKVHYWRRVDQVTAELRGEPTLINKLQAACGTVGYQTEKRSPLFVKWYGYQKCKRCGNSWPKT